MRYRCRHRYARSETAWLSGGGHEAKVNEQALVHVQGMSITLWRICRHLTRIATICVQFVSYLISSSSRCVFDPDTHAI